jgi:hypothetical protein
MRTYWLRALDGGARGIFWYSFGGSGTGWDSVRATPEHWYAFRRANRALADAVALGEGQNGGNGVRTP